MNVAWSREHALSSRTIASEEREKLLTKLLAIFLRESNVSVHISRGQPQKRRKLHRRKRGWIRRWRQRESHTYVYLLHLQRGVEIDGWNIDWLPYPRDSASLFHPPRNPVWDSSIVHVSRSTPACAPRTTDIPALLSHSSPLQPLAVASFYICSPIYRAHSKTFKLLCLSRNIACCLLPIHFTRNKSNRELLYFPEAITFVCAVCH